MPDLLQPRGTSADPDHCPAGPFADLAADGAQVVLNLATVPAAPRPRLLVIPDPALSLVAGLDAYGD